MSDSPTDSDTKQIAPAFPDHQTGFRFRLYGYELDFFVEDPDRPTTNEVVLLPDLVIVRGLQQQSMQIDVVGGPPGTIGVSLCREGCVEVHYATGVRTFGESQAFLLGDTLALESLHLQRGTRLDNIVFNKYSIGPTLLRIFDRSIDPQDLQFTCPDLPNEIFEGLCNLVDVAFSLHSTRNDSLIYSVMPTISASILSTILVSAAHSLSEMTSRLRGKRYSRRLNSAVSYIEQHLGRADLGVLEIARHIAMSTRSFQNLVSSETSMTPRELISEIRLTVARAQLRSDSTRSVAAIALACGFSNAPAFSRAYKARFGQSPTSERT